jgi:hypothetical protein
MLVFLSDLGYMEYILITIAFILPAILFFWALINCLKGTFEKNIKLLWILIILFAPGIGSIIYLVVGRKQRIA